jgi:hypothetical protein
VCVGGGEHRDVPWFPSLAAVLLASALPRVEDPIPESVGLGLLIEKAGAGVVLVGIAFLRASPARREKAINIGGLVGFGFGALVYLIALVVQLFSRI